jgi:hypothetical protein
MAVRRTQNSSISMSGSSRMMDFWCVHDKAFSNDYSSLVGSQFRSTAIYEKASMVNGSSIDLSCRCDANVLLELGGTNTGTILVILDAYSPICYCGGHVSSFFKHSFFFSTTLLTYMIFILF